MGALATLNAFFTWNSVEFIVTSASRPTVKVAVARDRPMMVRYCMCQPYESLLYRSVSDVRSHARSRDKSYTGLGLRTR